MWIKSSKIQTQTTSQMASFFVASMVEQSSEGKINPLFDIFLRGCVDEAFKKGKAEVIITDLAGPLLAHYEDRGEVATEEEFYEQARGFLRRTSVDGQGPISQLLSIVREPSKSCAGKDAFYFIADNGRDK